MHKTSFINWIKKPFHREKIREVKEPLSPLSIVMLVLILLFTVIMVVLLGWALLSSIKSIEDYRINKVGFPEEFSWNYSLVFSEFKYPVFFEGYGRVGISYATMFLYTILYALGCAVTATLVPCITAYLTARYDYKFSRIVTSIVIIVMIVPIVGNLPSEIKMAKTLGLFDQMWGLWVMKAAFIGMYFLVFQGIFKSMPKGYVEAAMVDGAGDFTIMCRVMLPLARNTFLTVLLLNFITYWNDYQVPLIYLPHYPTISVGLMYMSTANINDLAAVPMRMAAAMLVILPVLAVFLLFHKKLMGNLTVGGLKG